MVRREGGGLKSGGTNSCVEATEALDSALAAFREGGAVGCPEWTVQDCSNSRALVPRCKGPSVSSGILFLVQMRERSEQLTFLPTDAERLEGPREGGGQWRVRDVSCGC